MKLSEVLKDWPMLKEKSRTNTISDIFINFTIDSINNNISDSDREIDREALVKLLYDEFCNAMSWENVDINTRVMFLEHADKIISTMPTWLRKVEGK